LALASAAYWWFGRPPARASLLLVTIDTLRADRVGVYGHAGAETPNLDGLARRGARFEHADAAAPLTGPSHATILTGHYPPVHGVRDNVTFALDPRHATLATLLRRRGYRTAAFVAAYPVAADSGFGQGFELFEENFHQTPVLGQGAERPANEVAESATRWLAGVGREPFLLWVHFYDPHAPYTPPPPYAARFAGRTYDGEIAFADAQLGRVLEALRAAGRERDTLVAVLADHGEALGDHGERTHAVLIYEATLRVPFVLAGPGVPSGRLVRERVATVDLLPTVLSLMGQPVPDGLPGRDLRPALAGNRLPAQALYAESLFGRLNCRWASLRGWYEGDWKLIEGVEPELYDLADDPAESRNRAPDEPARVERMRAQRASALARMAPGGDHARAAALSPEQEERLRSLGYVGGGGGGGDLDDPSLPDPRPRIHVYERVQAALAATPGPAMDAALTQAAAAAAEDPGNPFAQFSVASLAYRSGRLALAERAFARTLQLDPDRPATRQRYGKLLRDMGKLAESERELRIAVEQTTAGDHATRLALAETLTDAGQLDEAQALIDAVLRAAPKHVEGRRALGRLLLARGRPAEAIPHLQEGAKGREVDPAIELAEAYLATPDPSRALEAAEAALARSPGHPWAMAVKGRALLAAGRRGEGLAALQRALALRPRRPEAWESLARGFEAAGDAARASACRRQAAAIRSS
jgi:arylsulfatase A-like enzyme/Tfp pilus assembly protein PilF